MSAAVTDPNYSTKEVSRLYRLSYRQLQWWDEHDIVRPLHREHRRRYSFDDVVWVGIAIRLRAKGLSLSTIRRLFRFASRVRSTLNEQIALDPDVYLVTDGKHLYLENQRTAISLMSMGDCSMFVISMSELLHFIDQGLRKAGIFYRGAASLFDEGRKLLRNA